MEHLPRDLQSKLELELRSGERLQWTGQPDPLLLTRNLWPVALFGLFWLLFSIGWTAGAFWMVSRKPREAGPFILLPLFGLPFIVIGIFLVTRPLRIKQQARRTAYAITNQRAIILVLRKNTPDISVVERSSLKSIEVKMSKDGNGDLLFIPHPSEGRPGKSASEQQRFRAVRGVQPIHDIAANNLLPTS